MSRLTVNGVDTYYEEHGDPDGTPVLFIHGGYGGPATTLVEAPNVIAGVLREGVRLITYDRRSAYRSAYVLDHYTLADIAEDAAALLDALDVGQAIVVGSSAGGPVALHFALSWPERVIALGLPNTGPALMSLTPHHDGRAMSDAVRARLDLVRERLVPVERARREGDRAAFAARLEELRRVPETVTVPPERRAALEAALAAVSEDDLFTYSTGMLRNLEAYTDVDFTDRLGELRMPAFIVHGTADATVPLEYGRDLHAGIPHAEFHEIPGAGHGILQRPEAQSLLREWVARVRTV